VLTASAAKGGLSAEVYSSDAFNVLKKFDVLTDESNTQTKGFNENL